MPEHDTQSKPWTMEEVVEVLDDLRKSAGMLQQNAEACAIHHYNEDLQRNGLPGWLADTQESIDRARALLSKIKEQSDEYDTFFL